MAQWQPGFLHWVWLASATSLLALACTKQHRWLLVCACIGGMLAGLWRGSVDEQVVVAYRDVQGKHLRVEGSVAQDASPGLHGKQSVLLDRVVLNNTQHVPGQLKVIMPQSAIVRRSDTIVCDGIVSGDGPVPTVDHTVLVEVRREQQGDIALDMREGFAASIRRALDEPAASLGIGVLLGQKQGLPQSLTDALRIVGLTHIVVASGYNLMILVRFARKLFESRSAYLATFVSGLLIALFVAITGASPSMTRAGLVAALGLVAWYLGRVFHPVTLLAFSAALTLLYSPSYAWGDVGWLLSFASFAGVLVVAPVATAYFYEGGSPGWLARLLIETGSALVATLPISVAVFGKWSVLALVANAVVLPMVPLAMAFTFAAGVGTLVLPSAAKIVGWPAQTLLDGMRWVSEQLARIDGAQLDVSVGWGIAIVWWLVLAAAIWYMKWRTGFHLRSRGGANDQNLV